MTEHHDLAVTFDPFDDTWAAWCSCEWSKSGADSEESAIDQWEIHCDQVFEAATYAAYSEVSIEESST
jgi:hypothetical protein